MEKLLNLLFVVLLTSKVFGQSQGPITRDDRLAVIAGLLGDRVYYGFWNPQDGRRGHCYLMVSSDLDANTIKAQNHNHEYLLWLSFITYYCLWDVRMSYDSVVLGMVARNGMTAGGATYGLPSDLPALSRNKKLEAFLHALPFDYEFTTNGHQVDVILKFIPGISPAEKTFDMSTYSYLVSFVLRDFRLIEPADNVVVTFVQSNGGFNRCYPKWPIENLLLWIRERPKTDFDGSFLVGQQLVLHVRNWTYNWHPK